MPIQYLLPCSCGRKIPVETRQAGGSISCECGASLEVPRLLEVKKLERAATQGGITKNKPVWGIAQGMILSGIVILIVIAVFSVLELRYGQGNPYDSLTPEQMHAAFAKMKPIDTWETWRYFQIHGYNPQKDNTERFFEGLYAQRQLILTFLTIAGAGGVALLVAGILIRRKRPSSSLTR